MSNYSLTDMSNLTDCSNNVNMTFVGDIEGKGVSVLLDFSRRDKQFSSPEFVRVSNILG